MSFSLDNYVTVDERIEAFFAKHPNGSLTSSVIGYPTSEYPFITVQAMAWRDPDDPCPAVAHSSEPVPGKTPYTKDSELENAETSAFGRVIIAVGAASAKRGIASKDEIANRKGAPADPRRAPAPGGFPSSSSPSGATTSPAPLAGSETGEPKLAAPVAGDNTAGVGQPASDGAAHPTPGSTSTARGGAVESSKASGVKEPAGKTGDAPTPASCAHTASSPLLPSGRSVKEGFVYCGDCRTVVREGKP